MSSVRKKALKSKELLSRLGGVSVLGVGMSFKPTEAERTVVRELLTGFEDRRVLFVQAIWEQPKYVLSSVEKMRGELTGTIKRLGEDSPTAAACRTMRGACRDFMTEFDGDKVTDMDPAFGKNRDTENFLMRLGALRATIGQQIALLAHMYEIDLEEQLASVLPPLPELDDKA
ncbi:DUF6650 family protein [Roseococcus sp.]|uniref:DUF6650 family protein n=1 Tax=Roseococcus sp. TaxID=2109646 RepID=UPI003BAB46B3